jgi:hypothetical protein
MSNPRTGGRRRRPSGRLGRSLLASIVGLAGVLSVTLAHPTASADELPKFPIRAYPGENRCLTTQKFISNGTPPAMATCDQLGSALDTQRWQVRRVEDPTGLGRPAVTINSMDNGRCLDADTITLDPFIQGRQAHFTVQMWTCNGWANQTWIVTSYVQALADFGLTGQRERRSNYTVTNLPESVQVPFQLRSADGPANPPAACSRVVVGPYICEPWLAGSQPGVADDGRLQGADYSLADTIVLDSPVVQCALARRGIPIRANTTDPLAYRCT